MRMDERLELLKRWLKSDAGLTGFDITPASSDASFRRYFRVRHGHESHIAMDAPPKKENCGLYVMVARALSSLGLNVPHIFLADLKQGFLLLSDFGVRSYLDVLDESNAGRLYGDALNALLVLQSHRDFQDDCFPPYDRQLLMNEMNLFRDWYLREHLGITLSVRHNKVLDEVYEILILSALEQPTVWVHRDFHSRNLMYVEKGNPGILDFQDTVIGPVTYDLVSLLRDCYIQWPHARVQVWLEEHYLRLRENKVIERVDRSQFERWFDLMGVQRHLKAIGIFSRLNIRDGKPGYMNDIPRTLGYVMEVSARYPELKGLNELLGNL
jgi:hypothetical protein